MRKLLFLPLLFVFTAFMCEADEFVDTETLEEVAFEASFPDAEPGEVVVEAGGAIATMMPDYISGGYDNDGCSISDEEVDVIGLALSQENADGSVLHLSIRVLDVVEDQIDIALEPTLECLVYTWYNTRVRFRMYLREADGTISDVYLSNPELGGEGFIEISDFIAPICCDLGTFYGFEPDEDLFGFVSGVFDVLLHHEDTSEPLRIRGRINRIPLVHAFETSPYL